MILALRVLVQTLYVIESQLTVVGSQMRVTSATDWEYNNRFIECKKALRLAIRAFTALADDMGDKGYK